MLWYVLKAYDSQFACCVCLVSLISERQLKNQALDRYSKAIPQTWFLLSCYSEICLPWILLWRMLSLLTICLRWSGRPYMYNQNFDLPFTGTGWINFYKKCWYRSCLSANFRLFVQSIQTRDISLPASCPESRPGTNHLWTNQIPLRTHTCMYAYMHACNWDP